MKKITIVAIAAALVLGGCQTKREKENAEDTSQHKIASLQRVIEQSTTESKDLAATIQQIRDGFRQINEAEGRVTMEQTEGSDQQAILENMTFIQNALSKNKALIAELRQQLRNANKTNKEAKAAYEAMVEEFNHQLENKAAEIENLRKQLAEKDIKIAAQDEQIDQLNNNVEDLTHQNQEKARTVEAQDQKIHTAWYVFGTKKELRDQNILQNGDVLRSSNFNKEYFTQLDIRVTKKIPLYSKKAEILTNHPASSYSLEKDAQDMLVLRITDAESFWSVSRYLVIQVK